MPPKHVLFKIYHEICVEKKYTYKKPFVNAKNPCSHVLTGIIGKQGFKIKVLL